MTVWLPVVCPDCGSDNIIKHGKSPERKQRYLCRNRDCLRCNARAGHSTNRTKTGNQAENCRHGFEWKWYSGHGASVAGESSNGDQRIKKKSPQLEQVNQHLLRTIQPEEVEVEIRLVEEEAPEGIEEAQLDEM